MEGLKSHINTHNNSIAQLDMDLHYILHGRPIGPKAMKSGNENS